MRQTITLAALTLAAGMAFGQSASPPGKSSLPTVGGDATAYDLSGARPLDKDASFGDLIGLGPATDPFGGPDINALVGADRFYDAGYSGSGTAVAIIEAFAPRSIHRTMQHLGAVLTQDGTPVLMNDHATYTGFVSTGRDTPGDTVETGIAWGADLWGGQLAVQNPVTGQLFTSDQTSFRTYIDAAVTGRQTGGVTADVINMSFGFNNGGVTGFINDVMVDAVVGASGVVIGMDVGPRNLQIAKQRLADAEADIRLFTTLVRFDPVYHGHFKCNRQRLQQMPNLWNYTLEIYQLPGVAETVNLEHIKRHYYWSHTSVNPTRVVPCGPAIDYEAPHDRARFDH